MLLYLYPLSKFVNTPFGKILLFQWISSVNNRFNRFLYSPIVTYSIDTIAIGRDYIICRFFKLKLFLTISNLFSFSNHYTVYICSVGSFSSVRFIFHKLGTSFTKHVVEADAILVKWPLEVLAGVHKTCYHSLKVVNSFILHKVFIEGFKMVKMN